MADVPESLLGKHAPMVVADAGGNATASGLAPFVYFDVATIAGMNSGGVAHVTLEAIRHMASTTTNSPVKDFVVVAHLRMGIDAVRSLRKALQSIEELAVPPTNRGQVN